MEKSITKGKEKQKETEKVRSKRKYRVDYRSIDNSKESIISRMIIPRTKMEKIYFTIKTIYT